jgi:hypothetical protein
MHMQGCNLDPGGSVTPDVMVFAVIVVVMLQLLARGVSRCGLVCAWVIVIVAVNVSLWQVATPSFLWINCLLASNLGVSYELERFQLRQFIKTVHMMEASETNTQLKGALAKSLLLDSERALEAKRSLVRHIGHGTFACWLAQIDCSPLLSIVLQHAGVLFIRLTG